MKRKQYLMASVFLLNGLLSICAQSTVSGELAKNNAEIRIGTQVWLERNLDVSSFQNGIPILEAKSSEDWAAMGRSGVPAWCFYNFDSTLGQKYGKLYNWYAVVNANGLAPAGWRIPTKEDWEVLARHLGGEAEAGGLLKSIEGWKFPNSGASNKSGFSALPGGYISSGGSFGSQLENGYWWSATENRVEIAWSVGLGNSDTFLLFNQSPMLFGFSVRCIKN